MKINDMLNFMVSYRRTISLSIITAAIIGILMVYNYNEQLFMTVCAIPFILIASYILCKLNDFSKEPMEVGTFFFFFWW
jgi:ABC-type bacteriocin/lantibiotic exporter with double-glycine peptidase domain